MNINEFTEARDKDMQQTKDALFDRDHNQPNPLNESISLALMLKTLTHLVDLLIVIGKDVERIAVINDFEFNEKEKGEL